MIKFDIENIEEALFSDLKKWFEDNVEYMPTTLDVTGKYYRDVKGTANIWISQISSEAKKYAEQKRNIKDSSIARSGKINLKNLYKELQDFDGWDVAHKDIKLEK